MEEESKTNLKSSRKLSESHEEVKLFRRTNQTVFSQAYDKMRAVPTEEDEDFLVPKNKSKTTIVTPQTKKRKPTEDQQPHSKQPKIIKTKIDPTGLTNEELALQILQRKSF